MTTVLQDFTPDVKLRCGPSIGKLVLGFWGTPVARQYNNGVELEAQVVGRLKKDVQGRVLPGRNPPFFGKTLRFVTCVSFPHLGKKSLKQKKLIPKLSLYTIFNFYVSKL